MAYWMCYAGGSWLWRQCQWILSVTFCALPLHAEAHLLAVVFLVSPRTSGIAVVQRALARTLHAVLARLSGMAMQKLQLAMAADAKASDARAAAAPSGGSHGEGPGTYWLVAPAAVTSGLQPTEETIVAKMGVGETVEVLEVVRDEANQRLRGRVQAPALGWISLLNWQSGKRWATRCDPAALQGAGLQDGLAAAAAAVGCDPAMLLGAGTQGKAGPLSPEQVAAEVPVEEAWEAMALLESQLARADDPSEAPGVRQASQMLRSMLAALAKGGNPAVLTMARTMLPDVDKIWAHEGPREYLQGLVGAGDSAGSAASGAGAAGSSAAGSSLPAGSGA